jgi:hypothetical protein
VFVRVDRVTNKTIHRPACREELPRHRVGRARPHRCRGNRRSADLARPPYNPAPAAIAVVRFRAKTGFACSSCFRRRGGRRPPPHSDLKVSAAAVNDESCQDNEKHNCGGDRPPVILAPPCVGPPAVVAARITSIFKVWVYHFRARASYWFCAEFQGYKESSRFFPRGFK